MTRPKVGYVVAAALGAAGIGYLVLSSQVEATREFNYGVKAYEDKEFDSAVTYFRRSAELSPNPTVLYNLALASWAAVNDAKGRLESEEGEEISHDDVEKKLQTAHEAIEKALSSEELDDELIPDLIYIEGRLLAVEDKAEEAKSRLRKALSLEEGFRPALRELVRLETKDEQDPMRQLLVTLAEEDEPELIPEYKSQ